MAYPNQHIHIVVPHDSRDHVIVPDTVKITLKLDIESTDKTRSIVNKRRQGTGEGKGAHT